MYIFLTHIPSSYHYVFFNTPHTLLSQFTVNHYVAFLNKLYVFAYFIFVCVCKLDFDLLLPCLYPFFVLYIYVGSVHLNVRIIQLTCIVFYNILYVSNYVSHCKGRTTCLSVCLSDYMLRIITFPYYRNVYGEKLYLYFVHHALAHQTRSLQLYF